MFCVSAALYIHDDSSSTGLGIPLMAVAVGVAALLILIIIIVAAILFTKHRYTYFFTTLHCTLHMLFPRLSTVLHVVKRAISVLWLEAHI